MIIAHRTRAYNHSGPAKVLLKHEINMIFFLTDINIRKNSPCVRSLRLVNAAIWFGIPAIKLSKPWVALSAHYACYAHLILRSSTPKITAGT